MARVRFEEPEALVQVARDVGEQIHGVLVVKLAGVVDGLSDDGCAVREPLAQRDDKARSGESSRRLC
jgi:hypothetical protein